MPVPASLRRRVITRAESRCEYCGLSHLGQAATFHVDHVVPVAAGGATTLANLALACIHCSLRKGARGNARDPATGNLVPLFHPRQQQWNHHFRWNGSEASMPRLEDQFPLRYSRRTNYAHAAAHPF